uniref:Uncharacterized protein n=1 Tax=Fagus sylvatica TaxID=28930 RepID=A0A2N9F3K2_FAGSY
MNKLPIRNLSLQAKPLNFTPRPFNKSGTKSKSDFGQMLAEVWVLSFSLSSLHDTSERKLEDSNPNPRGARGVVGAVLGYLDEGVQPCLISIFDRGAGIVGC